MLKQAVVAAQVDAAERSGFFLLCILKDAVAAVVQELWNVELFVLGCFDHQATQVQFLLQELDRRRMVHHKVSKRPQVGCGRLENAVILKRLAQPLVSLVLANRGLQTLDSLSQGPGETQSFAWLVGLGCLLCPGRCLHDRVREDPGGVKRQDALVER